MTIFLLSKNNYLYIGITALTPTFHIACKVASMIKEIDKNMPVVIGGVHPSVLPDESLKILKLSITQMILPFP